MNTQKPVYRSAPRAMRWNLIQTAVVICLLLSALLAYAEPESRCYWLKKEVDKRPVFILAHQLLDVRDNMALGAEREYYVGHTYNSMLMLIGVLPFEDGTLVFSANRVFTEKVTGFGSGLRKKLGRKVVGEKMARRFETVRTALERRQPATP